MPAKERIMWNLHQEFLVHALPFNVEHKDIQLRFWPQCARKRRIPRASSQLTDYDHAIL